jgi:PAT family beta-lactamase induction signal transducer AmpG
MRERNLKKNTGRRSRPWLWVPSLYFAEGIPYVVVVTLSVIFFKRMGISNARIAFYTSWLYLPWVIKPLWGPVVDILRTKRFWILAMQLLIGAGLAGVALSIPAERFVRYSLAFFWLLAFSSATHDIAADGFYMLGLSRGDQAYFVGIRSTFYRAAMLTGQGLLVILAGAVETRTGNIRFAWSLVFAVAGVLFALFFLYHRVVLPRPGEDRAGKSDRRGFLREYLAVFAAFFRKEKIGVALAFLLVYRLAESQLVKMVSPFLLDPPAEGGLGLSTGDLGLVYGSIGIIFLLAGGITGGIAASSKGLKYWIWWMAAAMNLPNLVYVFLSVWMPSSLWVVGSAVAFEQFGYGFGFTAYMLYMIYIAEGRHKTAHFALATGFMALGMMIPGLFAGWLQELLGYRNFFLWVVACTLPGFLLIPSLGIDPGFGKKT